MTDIVELGFKADTSGILKADNALDNLGATSGKAANQLNRNAKRVNSTFIDLNSTLGLVGASIAALGGAALTRDIVRYSDAFTSLNSQIRQVTSSEQELSATRERLLLLSNQTRSDIDATVSLYSTLQRSTKDLGLESEQLAEITGTINNLFLSSGASAQESSNAIRQLSQGLAAGALRGDEFNSVSENAPRIMDALAQSLNKSRGELREFAATGGITSEILIRALADYSDEAETLAAQTGVTFEQMSTVVGNNTTNIIGNLDFIGQAANSVGQFFIDLTSGISENVNSINFVVNELQRNFELAFAGIGFAVDVMAEGIEFAISSPLDFAKAQLVDFLNFVAEFSDKIDTLLPESSQLGFGDSLRGFSESLETSGVETYQSNVAQLKSEFDSLVDSINKARDTAADDIIAEEIEKVGNVAKAQEDAITNSSESIAESLTKTIKVSDDFEKTQNEIANGANRVGAAFQNSANGIIDTFGEATQTLIDFGDEMSRITELQVKLDAEKARGVDVTKEQAMLNEQLVSAQLSGIGSLLGASANLFDEQSKEREALHKAEIAFQAVEMAMTLQRSFAKGKEAIASAFAAPFPLNFAAGAAMIGIMSSLLGGGFGGGATEPVAPAGTGTTLGDSDAQSGSINNSVELFEDIQIDQLAELKGIRDGISDLAGGINQLTRSILGAGGVDTGFVQGLGESGGFNSGGLSGPLGAGATGAALAAATGGAALLSGGLSIVATALLDGITGGLVSDLLDGIVGGIFGKTSKEITEEGIRILSQSFTDILASGELEAEVFAVVETTKKKLFGLVKSESSEVLTDEIDSDFAQQLGAIFGAMGESLLGAADLLGMDVSAALAQFTIPELDISFTDKTGEEIEEELSAAIGSIGDQLAGALFPTLLQYQQINEGMFETVLRVTKETVIFEDALDKLAGNLDISGASLIDFGQNVIDAIGGLDNFNDAISEYVDNFFTERERLEFLADDLSEVFDSLNIAMPATNEEFRELVEATAMMGADSSDTLAVLLEISGAFAELTSGLENLEQGVESTAGVFIQLTDFVTAIRTNRSTDFLEGLTQTGQSMDVLLDLISNSFEGADNFAAQLQSIANNFGDATLQMDIAQEALASSISGAMTSLRETEGFTETEASELFAGLGPDSLRTLVRRMDTTADELEAQFLELINSVTGADVESGLFEQILRLEGAVSSYTNALRQQEEAQSALTEERNNRTLDLQIQLLRTQGHELEAVAIERSREIELLQEYDAENQTNLANIQALIYLQEDYNSALSESKDELSSVFDMLTSAVSAQRDSIAQTISELESARNRLDSAIQRQNVNILGGFDIAIRELNRVLAQARIGDFSGVSSLDLSTLTRGDTSGFSTRQEFNLEQARIATQLEELKTLTDNQATEEQQILETLESSFDIAKQQFNALMGVDENQVQQLIENEQYAQATDLAFAEFLSALADTNGLVALQEDNDEQRFQEFLTLQQALIDSGVLNTTTLTDAVANSDGLLSELRNVLTATSQDLIDAQDQTVDNVLNLTDIQQSLLDANNVNFQALLQLTDEERQQIVDNLNSLVGVTGNLNVDLSGQLGTANFWLQMISISLGEMLLKNTSLDPVIEAIGVLDQSVIAIADQAILLQAKGLHSLLSQLVTNQINQNRGIAGAIREVNESVIGIADKGILLELQGINDSIINIHDMAILSVLEELKNNQWNQNRGIALAIDSVALAVKDIGIDRSILDTINENIIAIADQAILLQAKGLHSLLSQLVTNQINQNRGIAGAIREVNQSVIGIADKGILLELQGINDSIINIHDMAILSVMEELKNNQWNQNRGIAGAIRDLDDTKQKVSLPNSHYNNQQVAINQNQAMISEMKKMNLKLRELTSNSYHQGQSIRENTRDIEKIVQNIELNGLRVRA